nr:GNAT family N-acetyltransferase [uncultured Acetatifactor sp.]
MFVEEMFIKPELQRRGYGSMLLGQIEKYVDEKGYAGITLSANKYASALDFYRKNRFLDCGHVLFMAKEMG